MKGKKDAFGKEPYLGSSTEEARIFRAGLRSIARDVVLEAIAEFVPKTRLQYPKQIWTNLLH